MTKNIIKALVTCVAVWLIVGLIASWRFDMTFIQGLLRPYSIFLAVAGGVGSFIGFMRKK